MIDGGGMQLYNMLEWNIHMHTYLNHFILDYTFHFQNLWPVFLSTENAYIKSVAKHKTIWTFNAVRFYFTLYYKLKQLTVSFLLQRPWCSAMTVHIEFVICSGWSNSEAACSKIVLSFI